MFEDASLWPQLATELLGMLSLLSIWLVGQTQQ